MKGSGPVQQAPLPSAVRVVVGFLLAPLAPAFVGAVPTAIVSGDPLALLIGTVIYGLFAYLAALAYGVPAYFLAVRLGFTSVTKVCVLGAFGGILSAIILGGVAATSVSRFLDVGLLELGRFFLQFAAFGAGTAWVFWWVVLRGLETSIGQEQSDAQRG